MTEFYPLRFAPVFKDYIWGGRNLEKLGKALPQEGIIAESWEIASHKDGLTRVNNGVHSGKTLPQLLDKYGLDLIGRNNQWALERNKFPLLVKLLDANQKLSVQVHPDDAYAKQHEGNELGKAEMWVVLWAKPEAAIIYGLTREVTRETFAEAIHLGQLEPLLHKINIKAGDHICVPTGTLHAILEGAILAEIQQNSNTTYRVYDWNRTDDSGDKRPLHINKALDVINFDQIKSTLSKPEVIDQNARLRREVLCKNRYFTTERIIIDSNFDYEGHCDGSTLEIWGVIDGHCIINGVRLDPVEFCLLPAAMGHYRIEIPQRAVMLKTYTGEI